MIHEEDFYGGSSFDLICSHIEYLKFPYRERNLRPHRSPPLNLCLELRVTARGEMSKKKFSAGSTTMTLKDFHGGSIPSELLLPSAPGIASRPADRHSSWIAAPNSAGAPPGVRADHNRPRPGSSGGLPRVLDERGPTFLSSPTFVGRHFDEDERKPFEAFSAPRRPSIVASEPTRAQPIAASQASVRSDSKCSVSIPAVAQHLSPSPGVSTSSSGNAWAARKEAPVKGGVVTEIPQTQPSMMLSGPAAASRFAQASAIEKISSGRWQSKPSDVEVIRFQDIEKLEQRAGESVRFTNDEDGHVGRAFSYSGVNQRKAGGFHSDGFQQEESLKSTVYPDIKEINALEFQSDLPQSASREGRVSVQHQHTTLDEAYQRPKLKLLPRTKPLETADAKIMDDKQGYVYPASLMHTEEPQEMCKSVGKTKPGSVGADVVSRPTVRPKLNLKPRTQSVEQHDETSERERKTVFGGARPREFVLKEREVKATDNPEIAVQSNRANKPDVPKIELKPEPFERAVEPSLADHSRSARDAERKDHRPNHERGDSQRNSRSENWRNMDKKPTERLPEPETWRKPVEPPKPEAPSVQRLARAASALELAQAFSRSMSDSRADGNQHANQKEALPGRTRIPFSRLTDTRARRHINGY